MKLLCTICMRGGSKGVKNKHLKKINGKPLLWYTINQALESKLFYKNCISTDSTSIAKSSMEAGADKVFIRNKKMALDYTPKLPVIRSAFKQAEKLYKVKFDTLIDLDATSPLRTIKDIKDSYKLFVKNKSINLISVCMSKKNPYYNIVEYKKNKLSISKLNKKIPDSRQQNPITYDMNASIYIWNRDTILKYDDLFFKKTSIFLMPEERSIDIDSKLDFKIVKFLMENNKDVK